MYEKRPRNLESEENSLTISVEPLTSEKIPTFIPIMTDGIRDAFIPVIATYGDALKNESEKQISMRTSAYYTSFLEDPDKIVLLAKKSGDIIAGLEAEVIDVSIPPDPNNPTFVSHVTSSEAMLDLHGKKVAYVNWVCVKSHNRGGRERGAGSFLYRELESLLGARGDISAIVAQIFNVNDASLRLHERAGVSDVLGKGAKGRAVWYGKRIQ